MSPGRRGDGALLARLGPLLVPALLLSIRSSGQERPVSSSAIDPYTKGDAEALARAGYRSFGPFRFGDRETEHLQAAFVDVPLLWVETEHFKIGSSLEKYEPAEAEELAGLKAELARLGETLPGVSARTKKLDPWLRLHLIARRLEDLHAQFRRLLHLEEGALSMPDKLTVLVVQKESTLARFTREFCGAERSDVAIHFFRERGALFYGVSADSLAPSDSALHYALVYGVAQNLASAVKGFRFPVPAWWQAGLALWFARRAEPRVLLYVRPAGESLPSEELADWEPLVRARVEGSLYPDWETMLAASDWAQQPFGDHIVLWSRIDFLLQRDEQTIRNLVEHLHGRRNAGSKPLTVATGLDLVALDAEWTAYVKANYRKKRR